MKINLQYSQAVGVVTPVFADNIGTGLRVPDGYRLKKFSASADLADGATGAFKAIDNFYLQVLSTQVPINTNFTQVTALDPSTVYLNYSAQVEGNPQQKELSAECDYEFTNGFLISFSLSKTANLVATDLLNVYVTLDFEYEP